MHPSILVRAENSCPLTLAVLKLFKKCPLPFNSEIDIKYLRMIQYMKQYMDVSFH